MAVPSTFPELPYTGPGPSSLSFFMVSDVSHISLNSEKNTTPGFWLLKTQESPEPDPPSALLCNTEANTIMASCHHINNRTGCLWKQKHAGLKNTSEPSVHLILWAECKILRKQVRPYESSLRMHELNWFPCRWLITLNPVQRDPIFYATHFKVAWKRVGKCTWHAANQWIFTVLFVHFQCS